MQSLVIDTFAKRKERFEGANSGTAKAALEGSSADRESSRRRRGKRNHRQAASGEEGALEFFNPKCREARFGT